ncbi:ATP-binding protein [Larkinella harenae]
MKSRPFAHKTKLFIYYSLIGLIAFLAVGCSFSGFRVHTAPLPLAQNGVIDLRTINFEQVSVPLAGTWKWHWQTLLQPGTPETAFEYTPFPKLWTQNTWHGQPLPSYGYATYTLTVLLPPNAPPLGLKVPDMYTACRIFLNGREVARSGLPGTSRETTLPFFSTQIKPIPEKADTLRILLQIANFSHSKGGTDQTLTLGKADDLFFKYNREEALNFFLTGCLFMGGLFFLGLFLFGRHEISILYFSLFCLLYSYRIAGSDQYPLHSTFHGVEWSLLLHLEYLSLFLGIAVFVLYTKSLYPRDVHNYIVNGMAWVCLSFAAITVIFPPIVFTHLINPFLVLMVFYIGYAFYVYWLAARRGRPGANYSLMSTGVLLAVFFIIILKYFQIAYPEDIILYSGYLAFFFLQSLVLSFRFAFTLQQAKDQAEEGLRTKNEFLSTISHEIRTPLNAVLGLNHLLLQDTPRADQKQHLEVIQLSARNLLHIVNDILDFNRNEEARTTLDLQPLDLVGILQNVVASYQPSAREKSLTLRLVTDPGFQSTVTGDPTRLAQVIANLVHNAIKFTERGHIQVSLDVVEQNDQHATVTIAVTDTGIGIAPENQEKIFNRFTQVDSSHSRSYGGTGMGLAISRQILRHQNVTLNLHSEPGKGSRFFFTQTFPKIAPLPAKSVSLENQETPPTPQKAKPLEAIGVLLVDDNALNVMLAKTLLERLGATVDTATNGQEALDMLDSSRHRVVLMDLQMPIMDGYEATRIMRQRKETLPIIAITASLAQEVGDRAQQAGLDEILVKPYNPGSLTSIILKHLHTPH